MRAHAFLAGHNQVNRHEPRVERDVRILKDSAFGDGELLTATFALPHADPNG